MTREQERRILVAAMAAAARMRDDEDGGVSRRYWDPESRALFEAVFDLEPLTSARPRGRQQDPGDVFD